MVVKGHWKVSRAMSVSTPTNIESEYLSDPGLKVLVEC